MRAPSVHTTSEKIVKYFLLWWLFPDVLFVATAIIYSDTLSNFAIDNRYLIMETL